MDVGPEGEEVAEETSSERAVAAKPAAMRVRVELIGPFEDGAPLRGALATTPHPEPVRSVAHDLLRHRRNEGLTKFDHQQPDLLIELVGEVAALRAFDLDQPGDIESVGREVVDRAAAIAARIMPLIGPRTLPRPLRARDRPLALPSLLASARYRRLLEDETVDDARVVNRAVAELGRRQAVWTAMTAMSAADDSTRDRDIRSQAWSEAAEAIWNPFIEVVVRERTSAAPAPPVGPSIEDPDELVDPVEAPDQEDDPAVVEAALADRAQREAGGIAGILERHARTVAADIGAPSDDLLLAFVKFALHRYRHRLTSGYQERGKDQHVIGIGDLAKDQDRYMELGVAGGQEAIDFNLVDAVDGLVRSIGRHADGADDTVDQMILILDVLTRVLDDPSRAPGWLRRHYASIAEVPEGGGDTIWSLHQATYPHRMEPADGSGVSDRQKKAMERIRTDLRERAAESRSGEAG